MVVEGERERESVACSKESLSSSLDNSRASSCCIHPVIHRHSTIIARLVPLLYASCSSLKQEALHMALFNEGNSDTWKENMKTDPGFSTQPHPHWCRGVSHHELLAYRTQRQSHCVLHGLFLVQQLKTSLENSDARETFHNFFAQSHVLEVLLQPVQFFQNYLFIVWCTRFCYCQEMARSFWTSLI